MIAVLALPGCNCSVESPEDYQLKMRNFYISQHKEIYSEGQLAAKLGLPITSNPYTGRDYTLSRVFFYGYTDYLQENK